MSGEDARSSTRSDGEEETGKRRIDTSASAERGLWLTESEGDSFEVTSGTGGGRVELLS